MKGVFCPQRQFMFCSRSATGDVEVKVKVLPKYFIDVDNNTGRFGVNGLQMVEYRSYAQSSILDMVLNSNKKNTEYLYE